MKLYGPKKQWLSIKKKREKMNNITNPLVSLSPATVSH